MVDPRDLPRGSTFHIIKDGKVIYDFPDAFGKQPGCWVEGVGFSDLDGDGLTDVIIAGRCLAARDSYGTNTVYVNRGSGFEAKAPSIDTKFHDLKTVKAIQAYVKAHPKEFF